MTEAKVAIARPRALHIDTVRDEAHRFMLDLGDGRQLFWCPINRVGSIYTQASGRWISEGPLGFMEFLYALSAMGIEGMKDHAEAQRWIETCLINASSARQHDVAVSEVEGANVDHVAPGDVPLAPALTTLRDARYTIQDDTGLRLVTWCPRSRAGGIYHLEARIWATVWPVAFGDFIRWLEIRRVAMDPSEDLVRWIEACTQSVASGQC